MKITQLRQFYPALEKETYCYLDSAATAMTHQGVIDTAALFYGSIHGNIHRGVHDAAEQTTQLYEHARESVAQLIGATAPEIIFTSGATDGVDIVAKSFVGNNLRPNDVILITQAEHHSNSVVWQELARQYSAELVVLPLDSTHYTFDPTATLQTISSLRAQGKTIRFAALTAESNVLGPVWGAEHTLLHTVCTVLKEHGTALLLDISQYVPHYRFDVTTLPVDFAVFSGHKLGGPTGVGVLYCRHDRYADMVPSRFGGGMVYAVGEKKSQWRPGYLQFEAGTPPIAQALGLGMVARFYTDLVNYDALREHETALITQLVTGLQALPGITVVAPLTALRAGAHLVSFYHESLHAHDIAHALGARAIFVRAGDHCAQPLSAVWHGQATVRISVFMYTTPQEIERCLHELAAVITQGV